MKLIVCFCLLFIEIYSSPVSVKRILIEGEQNEDFKRYMPVLLPNGTIAYEDLKSGTVTLKASLSDVTYYLYTKSNNDSAVIIKNGSVTQLASSVFDSSKPIVFITHGWNNYYGSPVNTLITAAILEKYDVNVFVVDWATIANKNYLTAKSSVQAIGEYEGAFITDIQNTYGLNGDNFILIGHSLGAHVAGCAGAAVSQKVSSIIGLDPAGPLFTTSNTANRLDSSDAEFVQIIHTDTSLLGFGSAIGDADYYPNGGSKQPGCGLDLIGTCSHGRSYRYLAESILNNDFTATLCDSYSEYEDGSCADNSQSKMGGLYVDTTAANDYYLYTNSESPYGQG